MAAVTSGFSQTVSYDTVFIAHYDDRRKAECPTSFGHLRNSLDTYEPILQFESLVLTFFIFVFDISLRI